MDLTKVYPITDRQLSGLSHAAQVERFAAGGARIVQVREKRAAASEFYEEAKQAVRVARERGVKLIVNDRVDVALAVGADGVHLGQDDLPPEEARAILGEHAIIGYSTHDVEQAIDAARLPVNYIAIGPIFATLSKENPDPVVGLKSLREVRAAIGEAVPLVAIGGITRETAPQVIAAGANAVAVISWLLVEPSEIEARTRELLAAL